MERDFLFLSTTEDWSNVGSCLARAVESAGYTALAAASRPNPARYPVDDYIYSDLAEARSLVESSRVVIFMQSLIPNQEWLKIKDPSQLFGVFHGSGNYRNSPGKINAVFNPYVDFTWVHTRDLLGLGGKNASWMTTPVDIDYIKPRYRSGGGPVIVGHFPSKKGTKKGTPEIRSAVQRMLQGQEHALFKGKVKFNIDDAFMKPWGRNIEERVKACDLYIESLCQSYNGKPIGEFGMAALEAAAAGKIVLTVFNSALHYEPVHGPHQIVKISNGENLYQKMKYWILAGSDEIRAKQHATRQWIESAHSFEAAGKRIIDFISGLDGKIVPFRGPKIWHREKSNIMSDTIGEGTSVGAIVEIGDGAIVGKDCKIQAFAYLPGGVVIGDRVFIGQGSIFMNDKHPKAAGEWELTGTVVEDDATIGAGAMILPGVRVGKRAVVGAGAVVTKDIPDNEIWVGNPATFLKTRESYDNESSGILGVAETA